jgi:hypothetical protein
MAFRLDWEARLLKYSPSSFQTSSTIYAKKSYGLSIQEVIFTDGSGESPFWALTL